MHGNNECKFGITNKIERKLNQYSSERPYLQLKYCKLLENRNVARLIEFKMKRHFNIISGYETTDAPLNEVIEFIESSKTKLEALILELPENLINKNLAYEYFMRNIEANKVQIPTGVRLHREPT